MRPRNRNLPKLDGEIVGGRVPVDDMEKWYETVTEENHPHYLTEEEWAYFSIEPLWSAIKESFDKHNTQAECFQKISGYVVGKKWSGTDEKLLNELISDTYGALNEIREAEIQQRSLASSVYSKGIAKGREVVKKIIEEEEAKLGRKLTDEEKIKLRKTKGIEALKAFLAAEDFPEKLNNIINTPDGEYDKN